MAKNLMNKTRKVANPYEVWTGYGPWQGWTWKILKKYQVDDNKPYARAFCDVTSPVLHGGSELGDVYIAEIHKQAVVTFIDPEIATAQGRPIPQLSK
mgnify:FL=1